jgi:hypothetical protein
MVKQLFLGVVAVKRGLIVIHFLRVRYIGRLAIADLAVLPVVLRLLLKSTIGNCQSAMT